MNSDKKDELYIVIGTHLGAEYDGSEDKGVVSRRYVSKQDLSSVIASLLTNPDVDRVEVYME